MTASWEAIPISIRVHRFPTRRCSLMKPSILCACFVAIQSFGNDSFLIIFYFDGRRLECMRLMPTAVSRKATAACNDLTVFLFATPIFRVALAKNATSVSYVGNHSGVPKYTVFVLSLHPSSVAVGTMAGNRFEFFRVVFISYSWFRHHE